MNDESKNEMFSIGILAAVAGGSVAAGLHELDSLLAIATPLAVMCFLTLAVLALAAAVVGAASLEWKRRMMTLSATLLLLGYASLLVSGWTNFISDPDMFDRDSESAVKA